MGQADIRNVLIENLELNILFCHSKGITSLESLNAYKLRDILDMPPKKLSAQNVEKHLLGCVILKEKETILEDNYSSLDDPWGKYRRAGVKVFDRVTSEVVVE